MDLLHQILSPYKDPIGYLAGIATIGQMFSGIPLCFDIRKNGSTEGFSVIPFLGGLIFGVLNLQFGFLLRDDTMINVNFIGLGLNLIYFMVFYWYTHGKDKTILWAQLGIGGLITALVIGWVQMEDPEKVEYRFGLVLSIFLFLLVGSPFLSLKQIIKSKSTKGLPFPMIASGTLVSFLWLLYSFCINSHVMAAQNLVVVFMSVIQLSLFVIYPSKSGEQKPVKSKKKTSKKDN